jgi:1-deoxy-D-xylulose-5-phosphate synthase
VKEIGSAGLLFEKLGFNYIGPVDGHNISDLLEALQEAKKVDGPVLLHARTYKGKGYLIAENNAARYHGVKPFNIENGLDNECTGGISFTDIFGDTLVEMAGRDERLVAITAAMTDGTGLRKFKTAFPQRFFDVGIAEQHAVVFAAGLARRGLIPFCVIYSTFLQRAYDALVHDIGRQKLPVVFAVDRAGLVGSDGATHHGCFDLSYLRHIPNMIVMAPKDGNELRDMLITAVNSGRPSAVRYPRDVCAAFSMEREAEELEIGKCEVLKRGKMLTIVSIGAIFREALQACNWLEQKGIETTLINARFVKPIDEKIAECISETERAIVVEENAAQGGFGGAVLELCQKHRVKAEIVTLGIPDTFIEHGSQDQLRKDCGLNWENIADTARKIFE